MAEIPHLAEAGDLESCITKPRIKVCWCAPQGGKDIFRREPVRQMLKNIGCDALRFFVFTILVVLFVAVLQASAGEKPASKSPHANSAAKSSPEPTAGTATTPSTGDEENDPDLPAGLRGLVKIDPAEYLRLRSEYIARIRGIDVKNPPDLHLRTNAIGVMEQQELQIQRAAQAAGGSGPLVPGTWTELGPAPIPNGQTSPTFDPAGEFPVSGRVTSIAVHPSNSNIVYVGAAQGGVYRSLDGGNSWTPLMDSAMSLAVGAIAISPSNPSTIFVGTGENNFSGDSFFGVGVYRIDNADATPVLVGPLNKNGSGADVMTGRGISKILVDPNNGNNIFVGTATGVSGLDGGGLPGAPPRGLYRSTNALASATAVTFTRLDLVNPATNGPDHRITDLVFEPGNANNLLAVLANNGGPSDGGVYRTTNALDPNPANVTFARTLPLPPPTNVLFTAKLAINKVGTVVTVLAGSGEGNGTLRRSVDGGVTWSAPLSAANGYCDGQCSYDEPVAIDPSNANIILTGGAANPRIVRKSIDAGATFSNVGTMLHADTHAIVFDPSNSSVAYTGDDGGIFKSTDGGNTWTSKNTAGFSATQFQSLALHPSDRNFLIGGTQDNGTEFMRPDGTWIRADFGDGGFALIDQSAADTTNVTMYHTYFNQTNNLIGFARNLKATPACAIEAQWSLLGPFSTNPTPVCDGSPSVIFNGMSISDNVLFYAPMALGPGTPNTVYFGTDRLYRSTNQGATMTVVSQAPLSGGIPISAIGISPQNGGVRIVGLANGKVFATTTGSSTLTDITGSITPAYVARAVIDPNNVNTAYITLDDYGLPAGRHIWKTTNLNGTPPTWSASGTGIPDVPVNSIVIDPTDSTSLYAATDIGVYHSGDSGATWSPFGTGLPRVACFDIGIQNTNRVLRVATHGRGIWEISLGSIPTTTTLVSSVNPSTFGQSVTFTATVSSGGSGTPTGTVQFKDGGSTIGSGTLSGGMATLMTSALNAGTHSITAVYGGDTTFAGSTSSVLTQTVNQAATTTGLAVDINPSTFGQTVTFTATVTANPPGSGTGTGTVTFLDGTTVLGSNGLTAGATSFATNSLAIGAHSITAVYNGDANFTGSTSSAVNQVVTGATAGPADIGVTATVSPNNTNAVVAIGAPLTFTITVTHHTALTTAHVTLSLSSVAGPTELDMITPTGGTTCTPSAGTIQCDIPALAPMASETVTLKLKPLFSDVRTFTGIASISSNTVDSGAFPHYVQVPLNVRPRPRGIRK